MATTAFPTLKLWLVYWKHKTNCPSKYLLSVQPNSHNHTPSIIHSTAFKATPHCLSTLTDQPFLTNRQSPPFSSSKALRDFHLSPAAILLKHTLTCRSHFHMTFLHYHFYQQTNFPLKTSCDTLTSSQELQPIRTLTFVVPNQTTHTCWSISPRPLTNAINKRFYKRLQWIIEGCIFNKRSSFYLRKCSNWYFKYSKNSITNISYKDA